MPDQNEPIPAAIEAAQAIMKVQSDWDDACVEAQRCARRGDPEPDYEGIVPGIGPLATIIAEKMAPAREREVEAAYREAWQVRNNYGRLEAQGANQSDQDFDWENSKARAALGQQEDE